MPSASSTAGTPTAWTPLLHESASPAASHPLRNANPLPRPIPPPTPSSSSPQDPLTDLSKHEVTIIGAGPAGMLASYLLTLYGTRVLTVEAATTPFIPGRADGLQPRTLEILKMLGFDEIFERGAKTYRICFWDPARGMCESEDKHEGPSEGEEGNGVEGRREQGRRRGITKTAENDDVIVATRFPHKLTLPAAAVLAIIEEKLQKRGGKIERGVEFANCVWSGDEAYPLLVTMREVKTGRTFKVLTKFLVGADGARSMVREKMGIRLQGETSDAIWGVVDAVVKTKFPDIRKRCAIHSDAGTIMSIGREKLPTGQTLTRLYTQMVSDVDSPETADADSDLRARAKEKRAQVTLPKILAQIQKVFAPYAVEFEHVDWWAAYQVGQRVAERFAVPDARGVERVFIVGDACHTHSPKAGQGMNISMMDAYNLSWKLFHVLSGVARANSLLPTYDSERRRIAQQLIDFDRQWAAKCSQKMGSSGGLTHKDFFDAFVSNSGFSTGCGVEYQQSVLVEQGTPEGLLVDGDLNSGMLCAGRRIMNVPLRRFCDDAPVQLHDVLPVNGAYTLLLFITPTQPTHSSPSVTNTGDAPFSLPPPSRSLLAPFKDAITSVTSLANVFPPGFLVPMIVHPYPSNDHDGLSWDDFPTWQEKAEWGVFGDCSGEGRKLLGIRDCRSSLLSEGGGAALAVVVRPDGVVGGIWGSEEVKEGRKVERWLTGVLRAVQ